MDKFKVLLVENEPDTRKIWKKALQGFGYEVIDCGSVSEAQDAIRKHIGNIDVAVIDQRLKEGDNPGDDSGVRLAREDIHGRIPVIMMTGGNDMQIMLSATAPGDGAPILAMLKIEGPDSLHRRIQSVVSHSVFIAHGHDDPARDDVILCLKLLGLRPVVLADEPRKNNTIIELLEELSNVSFAVVLLTPDDVGKSLDEKPDVPCRPRARQNVILEWGYFVGKLGRSSVTALCKENASNKLDFPSNYNGVLWTPMDAAGEWRTRLAKELNAAGIRVDASRVSV